MSKFACSAKSKTSIKFNLKMKKNIHRTLLYLLLSPLSFMALGQLPSIDPLPEKFRSVCHGRVDSIVEKRTLPDTDCGLQIYYFDNRNRIKNIVNECGYEQVYFYSQNDTAEILSTFWLSREQRPGLLGLSQGTKTSEGTPTIEYNIPRQDTSQAIICRDSMGRYRKIITDKIYTDFIYDKANRIIAYTVLGKDLTPIFTYDKEDRLYGFTEPDQSINDYQVVESHAIEYNESLNRQIDITTSKNSFGQSYSIHIFNSKKQLIKAKSGYFLIKRHRPNHYYHKTKYKNDKQGNWIYKKSYTRMLKKIEEREIYYKKQ